MDIVERLRKYQCPTNKGCNPLVEYCQCNIMDDSADEIERLQEALKLVRDELDRRRKNAEEARKEKE